MDDPGTTLRHFTKPELANFLAAQAVASAQGFIDGRGDAARLAQDATRIFSQLELVGADPRCHAIVDTTRLLLTAMTHAAVTSGPRAERWAEIMNAFVRLLRLESTELAATGAQRQ
jgi:hypothetical protein